MRVTCAEAFNGVPKVRLFVNEIDECGFMSFKWTADIQQVTTVGFEVKLYDYCMYSLGFS